jgi:hypothetical protein
MAKPSRSPWKLGGAARMREQSPYNVEQTLDTGQTGNWGRGDRAERWRVVQAAFGGGRPLQHWLKTAALPTVVLSLLLLLPGLTAPMITVQGTLDKARLCTMAERALNGIVKLTQKPPRTGKILDHDHHQNQLFTS